MILASPNPLYRTPLPTQRQPHPRHQPILTLELALARGAMPFPPGKLTASHPCFDFFAGSAEWFGVQSANSSRHVRAAFHSKQSPPPRTALFLLSCLMHGKQTHDAQAAGLCADCLHSRRHRIRPRLCLHPVAISPSAIPASPSIPASPFSPATVTKEALTAIHRSAIRIFSATLFNFMVSYYRFILPASSSHGLPARNSLSSLPCCYSPAQRRSLPTKLQITSNPSGATR